METKSKLSQGVREDFVNGLLTDFYQITMAYSLFKQNKHNQNATYDAFFRKCPFGGEVIFHINN